MPYRILDWESHFFEMTIAHIVQEESEQNLLAVVSKLKQRQVKLVFLEMDKEYKGSLFEIYQGYLVDKKTTFVIDFSSLNFDEQNVYQGVEPYASSMGFADIEELAIQSGKYSRFAVDPNFPKGKFLALYKTWIIRSVSKEIADEVLVIRESGRVVGLVTLGQKNARGEIGLLAVNKNYRGRGYGEMLVRAAQNWFIKNEYKFGQVVTQGQNIPAIMLYKKCHYSIEQVKYFYHFWL